MKKEIKKKLLISTDNFLPRRDGITRFLIETIPELKKHFDITLIAPEGKENFSKKIKKISIKKSNITIGDFRLPKFSIKKINKEINKAEIIFCQTLGPIGFITIILSWIKKKKIVLYTHSIESELVPGAMKINYFKKIISNIVKAYTKLLYNKTKLLMVPSEGMYELLTWRRIKTPKEIVKLGVDIKQFSNNNNNNNNNNNLKKKLGLKNEIIIGYHGRISREKDLITMQRAYIRIRKKYPETKLLIIGNGIKKIRKKLEKTPGIILINATEEVNKYLNLIDIYVLSSLTETTCLSILEAMSTKLPVISTPVGYVQDYIIEGITGLFFHKKDSFSLSKQIELLINNPILRKKLGNNARKMVEKNFLWKNTSKKIIKILKNV